MPKLNEFPEEGELVIGTVANVKNYGAFIHLDEYGQKEGFIHIAEVASGWIKYIRDHIREGQKVVCRVLRTDSSKGHIDLSLKQVNEHQRRETIQDWKNEQKAGKLLGIVAEKAGRELEASWEEFGYELVEHYGSMYRALEESAIDNDALKEDGFEGDWIASFVEVANENITPPYVNISGYLELTCKAPNGIEHIRNALNAVVAVDTEAITVQYVGAPRYRVQVRAPDYKVAEEILKAASDKGIESIEPFDGSAKFVRRE